MGTSACSTPRTRPPRQQQQQQQPRGAEAEASNPVFLNVYDVTPANGYARWLGLGVYHSGVQVHGVEYAYGAHDGSSSGIFEVAPRRCSGYTFREAVAVGATALTRAEVRALMTELADDFPGDAYSLVSRNCNHFCDAACRRLVRARIPRWVNRLAEIGVVFTCVVPGNGRSGVRNRSARLDPAAPQRTRTFFRSLSVGGRKNATARRMSTSPPPPPPPEPASSASTSSGSTT